MQRIGAVVVGLVLLAAACGDGSGDDAGETTTTPSTRADNEGPIGYPGGADDIVLRLTSSGGGPPPPGFLESLRRVPGLTVYGDGTLIRPAGGPDDAMQSLETAHLTEAGMQRMLAAAAEAGMLESRYLDHPGLADFGAFSFLVVTDAGEAKTTVYAPREPGGELPEQRAEVIAYREEFYSLADWMGAEMSALEPMPIERVRVVVPPIDPPFTYGEPVYQEWMLGDLADPATYQGTDFGGEPCLVISGSDLEAALPAIQSATRDTVWTSDEQPFQVVLRPLLPGDEGCL